jgi:hypothetical protein
MAPTSLAASAVSPIAKARLSERRRHMLHPDLIKTCILGLATAHAPPQFHRLAKKLISIPGDQAAPILLELHCGEIAPCSEKGCKS